MHQLSYLLTGAAMRHGDKTHWEGCCLASPSRQEASVAEGEGRNHRGKLLTSLFSYFPLQPRPICLGMTIPTVEWTILHPSSGKKMPTVMLSGESDGDNFLTEVPSSQVTQAGPNCQKPRAYLPTSGTFLAWVIHSVFTWAWPPTERPWHGDLTKWWCTFRQFTYTTHAETSVV